MTIPETRTPPEGLVRVVREPYPHLRDDRGCLLARDREHTEKMAYVVLACNSHARLTAENERLRISLEEMYVVSHLNRELAGYAIALANAQERARSALTQPPSTGKEG